MVTKVARHRNAKSSEKMRLIFDGGSKKNLPRARKSAKLSVCNNYIRI